MRCVCSWLRRNTTWNTETRSSPSSDQLVSAARRANCRPTTCFSRWGRNWTIIRRRSVKLKVPQVGASWRSWRCSSRRENHSSTSWNLSHFTGALFHLDELLSPEWVAFTSQVFSCHLNESVQMYVFDSAWPLDHYYWYTGEWWHSWLQCVRIITSRYWIK